MGRRIVIVGNGEIGDGLAEAIDAADLVMRFNDCRSVGPGGERTDIVAVCNTGTYLDPQQCRRVFERFYQIEDIMTRNHGGSGLGLAIARHLTELHHGQIWAESSPETGTCFYVALPVAVAMAAAK